MNLEQAKQLLPMTGQPVHINPAPDSHAYIDRQFKRLARCRDALENPATAPAERAEFEAEHARLLANIERAARHSLKGWARVIVHRGWRRV